MPLAAASLCAAERPTATRLRSAPEPMRRYVATLDLDNLADHAKLLTVYSDVMQDTGQRSRHGGDYRDLEPLKARWLNTLTGPGFEVDRWSFVVIDPSRPAISIALVAVSPGAAWRRGPGGLRRRRSADCSRAVRRPGRRGT
jgi:hypothetical protein